MTRRLSTAIRRRGRDFLIALIAVLTAAAAIISLVFYLRSDSLAAQPAVAATLEQIDRARLVVDGALAIADGDLEAVSTIEFQRPVIERAHHGLRFGDSGLGLDGATTPRMQLLFTGVEPSFERLREAMRSVIESPADADRASTLVTAAAEYATNLAPILDAERATTMAAAESTHRVEVVSLIVVLCGAVTILIVSPLTRRRRTSAKALVRLRTSMGEVDHLTGLPRRAAVRDHLTHVLNESQAKHQHVALLRIDIDDTRAFNATYGRDLGDRMLQEVASRLRSATRGSDLVARLDADEFAVVISAAHRPEDAGRVAEKIASSIAAPMELDGTEVQAKASVGVAVSPIDGDTADDLQDKAAMALHAAKRLGGGNFEYFAAELTAHTQGRLQILDGLRTALRTGDQLWIAYQPQISLRDGSIVGVEALIRWSHPTLGGLLPADFIPIAEETDVILELGSFVLEGACRQAAAWKRSAAGSVPVSVNVSVRQFRHGDLHDVVAACLAKYGLPPDLLEIELTEGVLMDDNERALETMAALRELGVRIAVDDFGTGYSSLSYLKRFPIDSLKIDRSFISELREGSEDAAISTAIIALAHSLDLEVIAEGVETTEQLSVLRALGCDSAQGFLLARPLPASAVDRLAKAGRVDLPQVGWSA